MDRVKLIRKLIEEKYSPEKLEVIDNSHLHVGHAGSQNGAGHYQLVIRDEKLNKMSRIQAHKEIYTVLAHLIPDEIHALQIKIET